MIRALVELLVQVTLIGVLAVLWAAYRRSREPADPEEWAMRQFFWRRRWDERFGDRA